MVLTMNFHSNECVELFPSGHSPFKDSATIPINKSSRFIVADNWRLDSSTPEIHQIDPILFSTMNDVLQPSCLNILFSTEYHNFLVVTTDADLSINLLRSGWLDDEVVLTIWGESFLMQHQSLSLEDL